MHGSIEVGDVDLEENCQNQNEARFDDCAELHGLLPDVEFEHICFIAQIERNYQGLELSI